MTTINERCPKCGGSIEATDRGWSTAQVQVAYWRLEHRCQPRVPASADKLSTFIAWLEQERRFTQERYQSDYDEFWNGCLTAIDDDLAAARLILHGELPTEPRSYL